MRANLRRSRARRRALIPGSPDAPTGQGGRPVPPWAALRRGLVGSPRPHCPPMAPPGPTGPRPESRVQRGAQWVAHAPRTAPGALGP